MWGEAFYWDGSRACIDKRGVFGEMQVTCSEEFDSEDVVSGVTDGLLILDNKWNIQRCNCEAVRMLSNKDKNMEPVVGRIIWDVFPHLLGTPFQRNLVAAIAEGSVSGFEYKVPETERRFNVFVYQAQNHIMVFCLNGEFFSSCGQLAACERADELQRLLNHFELLCERERKYITREMHDHLGQLLSVARIKIKLLLAKERGEGSDDSALEDVLGLIDDSLGAMREIAGRIRPKVIDDLGLGAAVKWLIEKTVGSVDMDIRGCVYPDDISVDPDRSIALYRILQEALTNVIRHSGATKVDVTLRQDAKLLLLMVRDNGNGDVPRQEFWSGQALGLVGMRERASQFGGELIVTSSHRKGTILKVLLPIE